MKCSENIGQLAGALAKAQGEIEAAITDGEAKVETKTGRNYSYTYASLAAVWGACRAALSKNELSVFQITECDPEFGVTVITRLAHSSGEWIEGSLTMKPVENTPQSIGSCMTYARRYALSAMVGVAPDDDDDGAAAMKKKGGQKHQDIPPQVSGNASPNIEEMIATTVDKIRSVRTAANLSGEQAAQIMGLEYGAPLSLDEATQGYETLCEYIRKRDAEAKAES